MRTRITMNNSNISESQEADSFYQGYLLWVLNRDTVQRFYVPAIVFTSVLLLIGLVGNGMVIYVYQFVFKRSPGNLLIKWLAVADWNSCFFGLTFEIVDLSFPLLNGEMYSCKIFRSIEHSSEFLACTIMLCIAYDRYVHICKPTEPKSMKYAYKLVFFSVVCTILISIPALFTFGVKEVQIKNITTKQCSYDDSLKDGPIVSVYYLILGVILIAGIGAMLSLYALIARAMLRWKNTDPHKLSSNFNGKSSMTEPSQPRIPTSNRRTGKQRNVTKSISILFLVTVVFILGYIPYIVQQFLLVTNVVEVGHMSDNWRNVWEFFNVFYFVSNSMNPLIYAALNKKFSQACYTLLFVQDRIERTMPTR